LSSAFQAIVPSFVEHFSEAQRELEMVNVKTSVQRSILGELRNPSPGKVCFEVPLRVVSN
jgi:hypothetical protein